MDSNMTQIIVPPYEMLQKEMCTCCLRKDDNSTFLNLSPDISEMFTSVTRLHISLHDNVPDRMCQRCHDHLLLSNKYNEQCKWSHNIITNYVLSQVKCEGPVQSDVPELEQDQSELLDSQDYLVGESKIQNINCLHIQETRDPIKIKHSELQRCESAVRNKTEFGVTKKSHTASNHKTVRKHSSNLNESGNTVKLKRVRGNSTQDSNKSNDCDSLYVPPPEKKPDIDIDLQKKPDIDIDLKKTDSGDCETCSHDGESTDTADEDIITNTDKLAPKFNCSKCNKGFYYLRDLGDHMNEHKEIMDRTCDICGKVLTTKGGMMGHRKIHTDDKKFSCDICGLRFVHRSALKYHKTTHTGEKTYSCEKCGKKFRTLTGLKNHGSTHSTDTPYECMLCGKRYKSRNVLYTHRQRCGKDKRHCCDTCGKLLSTLVELSVHIRSHTKEKPFPCPHCDKRYRTQSHRAAHVRTHTGERPHVCVTCGKAFHLRRTMLVHMRIHTGELPYECNVCGRRFRQAPVLKTHMKVHKKCNFEEPKILTGQLQELPKCSQGSQNEKEDIVLNCDRVVSNVLI